jgi:hypothetical protein
MANMVNGLVSAVKSRRRVSLFRADVGQSKSQSGHLLKGQVMPLMARMGASLSNHNLVNRNLQMADMEMP